MSKTQLTPVLLDSVCDRCGKQRPELRAWKFSPVVVCGIPIEEPWLCVACFKAEKKLLWANQ